MLSKKMFSVCFQDVEEKNPCFTGGVVVFADSIGQAVGHIKDITRDNIIIHEIHEGNDYLTGLEETWLTASEAQRSALSREDV